MFQKLVVWWKLRNLESILSACQEIHHCWQGCLSFHLHHLACFLAAFFARRSSPSNSSPSHSIALSKRSWGGAA